MIGPPCAPIRRSGVFVAYAYVGNGFERVDLVHFPPDGQQLIETHVSTDTTDTEDLPMVVADGTGGAFVVWQDLPGIPLQQIHAQHVLGSGAYATGWPTMGLTICSTQTDAGTINFFDPIRPYYRESATSDGTGGFYVTWTDHRVSATEGDIYAQHVSGDGTISPGWPVDGLAICTAPGDQRLPVVAADGQGGLLLTWEDARSASMLTEWQRRTGP